MMVSSIVASSLRLQGAAGSALPSLPAAPTTIEISDVFQSFDGRDVLRGISVTLTERRIGIVGANGSGKSTFARLLNGLMLPDRGTVRIDGLETAREARAVRRKVGFVFQNPDTQIVLPTVEEDIAFGLKGQKSGAAERAAKVTAILDRFGLADLRQAPAHRLSGGQKQLLAIAGVLITAPDCIVFDEPTTLLDLRNARRIGQVIADLAQTAIVVTHDLPLLAGFDRVLVFDQGRIVADDEPGPALRSYVERMT